MSLNLKLTLCFSFLTGFCVVLLAYFAYVDGKVIEHLAILSSRLCKATNVSESTEDLELNALVHRHYKKG